MVFLDEVLLSGIISLGGNRVVAHARKTEDALEDLHRLRQNFSAPAAAAELRPYLLHKSNLVVAKAARLAGEFEVYELEPDLASAFERFMRDPVKTDRGCSAKKEIARALEALGAAQAAVFLTGVRHVQMEGSFGPSIDTAPTLRAASAMGLVHMNHPDAILEIVTLLMDREADARIGAVRALGCSGRPESVPLLRLKVLQPDPVAEVMGECFTALLALAPETSVDFIAPNLDAPDAAVAEAAALALGESHHHAAIEALKSRWHPFAAEPLLRALLVGLALARVESAFEFLFSLIETSSEKIAAEVISSLAIYRHDDRIRSRIAALVASRQSEVLQAALNAGFAQP
jgi:HEAT repeat protein